MILLCFLLIASLLTQNSNATTTAGVNMNIRDKMDLEQKQAKGADEDGTAPKLDDNDICRDTHIDCDLYADQGECETSPGWTAIFCPVACNICHLRYYSERCKIDQIHSNPQLYSNDNKNIEYMTYNRSAPIYAPGDMNKMFESIEKRFHDRYEINYISRSPYIITIDNFLTNEEQRALIQNVDGWERSTDTGQVNAIGTSGKKLSTGRTSSNAWCTGECEKNPIVANIYKKIAEVTKIPKSYYESFQVLRYEINQKYVKHHDNGKNTGLNAAGPRVLTFFLYLSDVEDGGETCFTYLNYCIQPKRGRALLWPSTLDRDPMVNDGRTVHEAKPVKKGRKFAANTWIHLYDLQLASAWQCAGGVMQMPDSFKSGLI